MLTREQVIRAYRLMLVSRSGDIREQRLIRQGRGLFHVSGMGHEGIGVGVMAFEEGDYYFPFYRDRALAIFRGVSNYEVALSFFAKRDCWSGGRQLPGHYSSRKHNIWSVASPIAVHMLPACGLAWGLQMDGKKQVVFTSVGDGGTRQGDFYEAVCFAKERKLPMVFVVEDNGVAISTRTEGMSALAVKGLSEDWEVIDGTDVFEVYEKMKLAGEKARRGEGPQLLWARVERLSSHSSADDHRNYRSESEIAALVERDPIVRLRKVILEKGWMTEGELVGLEGEVEEMVKEDYTRAETAADPERGDESEEVYELGKPDMTAVTLEVGSDYRMADAINLTFKDLLKRHPGVCFFGEDVEDPLGGVFKLTKGLSGEYPGRVANAPLAESTILGVAAGLASYGKKPIFEIQFVDFISPGWNQLVNSLATLRWRTRGDWKCPAIIYAPTGAYLPGGGIWHSQSNESVFAHYPGLIVVMPSTPEDASGLLHSAMAAEDPVLFLIPKHMLWATSRVKEKVLPVEIGKAAVRTQGKDVTVVSWGNCMEVVYEAKKQYLDKEYSVELIDLRSIEPWDKETIKSSVAKTGRLVVVQEDTLNCSVGQMIISEVVGDEDLFARLLATPVLVSKGNTHIGYNHNLEYSALPDVERVRGAVDKVMHHTAVRRAIERGGMGLDMMKTGKVEVEKTTQVINLPNLGEGLREARLVEIYKQVGDFVKQDDAICEVETDKAVFPVESPMDGVLTQWFVEKDAVVTVGSALVELASDKPLVTTGVGSVLPAVEKEVGRMTDEKGALSRGVINQLEGVILASLSVVARWEPLREIHAKMKRDRSFGVFSYTTMVAWAVVRAMEKFPNFCRLLKNGEISEPQKIFDVGFAVALDNDELETAVISRANELSWTEFAKAYRENLRKVEAGEKQTKSKVSILLTSMGPLNIRNGYPIVVPPAVGTLFIGEPYYEIDPDSMGKATREVVALDFSFDHRWANGAGAGKFLKQVKENIESFTV